MCAGLTVDQPGAGAHTRHSHPERRHYEETAAAPGSIILVLDDHHTIESSPADSALAFLLERLPPQMHLVIASREDPHQPLAHPKELQAYN